MTAPRGHVEKQQPCKTGLGSDAVRSSPRASVSSVGGRRGSSGSTCDTASSRGRGSSNRTSGACILGLQIGTVSCKAAKWWRANVLLIYGHWRPVRHSNTPLSPFRLNPICPTAVTRTWDRGVARGSRVCCSISACTMAHHTSCRSSAQCTRKRNSWIPFCRTVRNHAHLSILACCCSAVLSNPEPVRRFLVACWMWPNLTYRSTANTSQHLLTVAQTHLFWVYMDRACECGQGALKYSCSFISEAAKSYHAALKIIDA